MGFPTGFFTPNIPESQKNGTVLLLDIPIFAAISIDMPFIFTDLYNTYSIIGEGVTVSADDSLLYRFANGGVIDTGSNYYQATEGSATTSAVTSLTVGFAPISAGLGGSFEIIVKNVNDTINLKTAYASGEYQSATTPQYNSTTRRAYYIATKKISGISLYWNSASSFGNSGRLKIVGHTKY